MTIPAKEHLTTFWAGDEVPGLIFYGLRSRRGGPEPDFPTAEWGPDVQARRSRLSDEDDPTWEVLVWDVWVPAWPTPDRFRLLVEVTLSALRAVGCPVAWLGAEGHFADPPQLLTPEAMSEGVLAALSDATGFLCPLDLDEPMRWLDDEQLLALRASSNGLAGPP